MFEVAFAIPGDDRRPTGGYAYDRAVKMAGPGIGLNTRAIRLPDGFPFPSESELTETETLLGAIPEDQPVLVDGLAFGALPVDLLRRLNRPWVALCHHPLAMETGLSKAEADRLRVGETAALAEAREVIVTSAATADLLTREFGVSGAKLTVAPPGVTRRPRARRDGRPPPLLAVGAVIPRKGYDVLVEALNQIRDRDWLCRIVGSTTDNPAATRGLTAAIERHGFSDRIMLTGAIDDAEVDRAYSQASIFVHPAHFEGYGMAVADALAAGLPVVTADIPSMTTLAPDGTGLRFAAGDSKDLGEKIAALLDDEATRDLLAERSWSRGRALLDWPATTELILQACRRAAA